MNRKILAILMVISITLILVTPIASQPNPTQITYATIEGPDANWGNDPAGAYDTASSTMLQQVYEPLFMYNGTSTASFIAMLADTWLGYGLNAGNWITPSAPDPSAPPGTNQTWYFHIRQNVPWQNLVYGTLKPHDVAYSIQRGMLQDAGTGVQWLMYGSLTGAGPANSLDPMFDRDGDEVINSTEYFSYLEPAIAGAIGCNDTTGYVWFNLPTPYPPFMQILTQGWAFIVNKQWCIERGCWKGDFTNYTDFQRTWRPPSSPLMTTPVISSKERAMGTGPYTLATFNTDPDRGFQEFKMFNSYWQGWPAPGAGGSATKAVIDVVKEWMNRKVRFLINDPSLQVDLVDVPRANYAELHMGGDKDGPTIPGVRLTKYYSQMIGSLFFCYNVSSPSEFMPKLGGVDKPDLFSDRDLRLAFICCFNDTQFLQECYLGEAIQPTTIMPAGTAYYNASKEVRAINLTKATQLFQRAWGGNVWSQGITVKLVYNTGNLAGQTIMSMIADTIMNSIAWPDGVTVDVEAIGIPWSTYMPARVGGRLPVFVLERTADHPDPADWFGPLMDPAGTFAGISQRVRYGINATNMAEAWSSNASYGPPPYLNALGETVTEINNTYVHHIIVTALVAPPATREKLYNELMDIYFAEGAGDALYQPIARHYERDWVNGWVGGYSNNPIAVGPYFYQMWKATLPTYNIDLVATSIQNTTYVPPITLDNLTGNMLDWKTLAKVYINYTLTVTYANVMGPIIYAAVELERTDIWTGDYYFTMMIFYTLFPGQSLTISVTWSEDDTMTNGIWKISLRVDPIGAPGGVVLSDTNWTNNVVDSPHLIKSIPDNKTYSVGDLGRRVYNATSHQYENEFFVFDGNVTSPDLQLFLQCYKGTAPPEAMYLADLGGGYTIPPEFFAYDGVVKGNDLWLFIQCYKGHGPDP